ncbi:hypothetical protein [Tenacibaculum sp. IB213877]|uniref:hypothetical protein n=1 Tax=Tenacibaculum sp. IB213877 TaxID=3097351 RepID=UPI002A5A0A2D|nr:hypothetical protein [Tenacibaculum sp. IB213877]MDY0780346.1 hypothetical protein [Tenacibaculum sp. IB213877]
MKLLNNFLVIATLLLLASCSSPKEKNLQNYMVGSWETEYIKIEFLTINKSDSTSVFEDDFKTPNAGKAQSNYKKDGTFSAWFKQADGTKINETSGIWKTKGDSLYVDYPYLGKQVQAWYIIKQTEKGFDGKVIYDWDNDGEFDDTLIMKTKRILQ